MNKTALKADRKRFVSDKAQQAHKGRQKAMSGLGVVRGGKMVGQQGEIDKALRTLALGAKTLGTNPEKLRDAYGNVAANQAKVTMLKDMLRSDAAKARLHRGLIRRTIPRAGIAAGAAGVLGLGAYGMHRLNNAPLEPVPAMQPLKRNKLMDAIYYVFGIEPNLPEFEPVKASSGSLVSAWGEGFEKYCHEQGVDAVALTELLLAPDKQASVLSALDVKPALEKLWRKLGRKIVGLNVAGLKLSPSGSVMPGKLPQSSAGYIKIHSDGRWTKELPS